MTKIIRFGTLRLLLMIAVGLFISLSTTHAKTTATPEYLNTPTQVELDQFLLEQWSATRDGKQSVYSRAATMDNVLRYYLIEKGLINESKWKVDTQFLAPKGSVHLLTD